MIKNNPYYLLAKEIHKMIHDEDIDLYRNNKAWIHSKTEMLRKIHDQILHKNSTERIVSKNARKILIPNGKGFYKVPKSSTNRRLVRYEHIFDLNTHVRMLINLPIGISVEQIIHEAERLSVVALITLDEVSALPKTVPNDWDGEDVFIRAKMSGLFENLIFPDKI